MSYYEKGMGAALVAELNKEKLTFIGGTGLLAIQLRDTCLFADAAADRIMELEAALKACNPALYIAMEQAHPRQKDHWHKIMVQLSEALDGSSAETVGECIHKWIGLAYGGFRCTQCDAEIEG